MFCFLLLAISSACNLSGFSDCYKLSKDSVQCIKVSGCITKLLEVKLESSLIHIKGFSVESSLKPQVSDLISCDLRKYEDCFSMNSSKTVNCLVLIDCLDFTEISELNLYNSGASHSTQIVYFNFSSLEGTDEHQTTSDIAGNKDTNQQDQPHAKIETISQNLYKEEVGLLNQRPADDQGIEEYETLTLEQISEKINETFDNWEIARLATGNEKEKYRDYFDRDGNLIDIDVKLEGLYKAYRIKIHEEIQKINNRKNETNGSEMFKDVNQEFPEKVSFKKEIKENQFQDSLFNEIPENDESFIPTTTYQKIAPVQPFPTQTAQAVHVEAKEKGSTSFVQSEETKDFEKLWNPSKPEEISNKQTQIRKSEDSILSSNAFTSEEKTDESQEKEDESEFEPILRDLDSSSNDSELDSYIYVTSLDSEESGNAGKTMRKSNFLEENISCEENCNNSCKSSDSPDSCMSECIYKTCSSSPANTSDYMTVLVTGLVLFMIAFIIYVFMKNGNSSVIDSSYIKGHSS